ncbi:MAG: YeeE/YedE family protein [Ignavibacteria bacterium]|nr:YeeE/YedE family protein [Ignavibacteria bacterium]
MIEFLRQPWHWYVAGVLIGLIVPVLLLLGNKKLGVSSSLRHFCAMCMPSNISFFKYEWKNEIWNLVFIAGILIGGFLATMFLQNPNPIEITDSAKESFINLGIKDFSTLMPVEIFSWKNLFTPVGLIFFVFGGFLIGFGTRYAGGCTSGHTIMGLSNLQLPSLYASIAFMVGGYLSANYLIPLIFKLLFA